ncbi:type I-C CRISPR-associated protein Cas7/Csd2 [Stappia sp. MMSF_3263]|uniref:type I-C CRISPR-associated protein Cas7/Csd2 n=1 Tax=Stappia sp. MMSF_3263 TaxID=3046693 RepID=UPI00273E56AD|nr:type I-C CRISPR-associated protein Cas7/Csd2 [Stappia sp. MMSF_3263]
MTAVSNRYDIVFLFDVVNGNPNGDPDAGNLPRMDPQTNIGLVSDVSLKRKIRNFTELARGDEPGYRIYVQDGSILNEQHREAYRAVRGDSDRLGREARLNPQSDEEARALVAFMCENFFDVRAFGAVMSTGINAGQVRGPVQVAFARSVEPILPLEISVTRMAATAGKDKDGGGRAQEERTENRTMGRKHIVPYGLYRAHVFINAKLAEKTGFSDADLTHLFLALKMMFEHDRSAVRGEMSTRRVLAFRHANALGNAPAHVLFDRVKVARAVDGQVLPLEDKRLESIRPARAYSDYAITVESDRMPAGVEMLELV